MKNVATSVRAKLLNYAKDQAIDFNQVMTQYVLERLLYRISISNYSEKFVLKGGLLFTVWFENPHRPTRDIDFLGIDDNDLLQVKDIFREIVEIKCEDGVLFRSDSLKVSEIRGNTFVPGTQIVILADLDGAVVKVQVDIGFGDTVVPSAKKLKFPVILTELPQPILKTYSIYSVIAEKYHSICNLGLANSRMKDYLDIYYLLKSQKIDKKLMIDAIRSTFEARETKLLTDTPVGLSIFYYQNEDRLKQWVKFLKKNRVENIELEAICVFIQDQIGVVESKD